MVSATPPASRALSALDLAFFLLETPERMSNVGPLAILRPPPGARSAKAFADALLRAMKRRPIGPPFDLRYQPPGLHGMPRLVAVGAFDLDAHCFRQSLPTPGTDAQLFDSVCRLHEQRLDRSRPLWELHVIDGLERGRIALYFKAHHGMMDGRGLVAMFSRWFVVDAGDRQARAPWEAPPRSARAERRGSAAATATLATKAGAAGRSLLSLYAALARQALSSAGMSPGLPLPFLGTPLPVSTLPSTGRSFAYCVLPLAALKALGKAHDATVNDMLLTVLDIAMNRYFGGRGKGLRRGAALVADMPVALSEAGAGNQIAILQFPLGAAAAAPLQRLAQIKRRTAEVKEHVRRTDAAALVTYTAAVHGIPALLEALGVSKAPALANAVISNPFGLPERRFLGGAELEMALPVSVLAPGQALNITAATYDQGLQIAFLGLAQALPDIERLADLTLGAFDELSAAAAAPVRVRAAHTRKSAPRPAQRPA